MPASAPRAHSWMDGWCGCGMDGWKEGWEKKNIEVFKKEIIENMKNIQGNFRQDIIRKQWKNYDKKKEIWISTFEATVSTGFYIRQLINTLGNEIELLGMAFDINRIYIHI